MRNEGARHTRHDSAPNLIGKDPDIEPMVISFNRGETHRRPRRVTFHILISEGPNLRVPLSQRVPGASPCVTVSALPAGVSWIVLG